MKILSATQLQEADKATIREENISSALLMERASTIFTESILHQLQLSDNILIVCGTGNNGGDGLCIARMLIEKKYTVKVAILEFEHISEDFTINFERLKKQKIEIDQLHEIVDSYFNNYTVIIDAILGTGINRSPSKNVMEIFKLINAADAKIISVDVPSGFTLNSPVDWPCIHANYCITFETPKLGFLFPENYDYIKSWEVKSIGLSQTYIQTLEATEHYITESEISALIRERKTFDHKGTFGHALLIAGNTNMSGAALLCGYAALKTGCGLVTIANDRPVYIYPELMFTPIDELVDFLENKKIKSIGIGPGLGINTTTLAVLKKILSHSKSPLVLDADALNLLAENSALMKKLPENCILTPHPGEFEKLFGATKNSYDRLQLQKEKSQEYNCIIIYKTAYTCISFPDGNTWFNSTGNPGMATAGSGDVLTGIITSLLAQGYSAKESSFIGVFIHGKAGDIAMDTLQQSSLVATDIINFISKSMKNFTH